jgi:hypothetical protein
VVGQFNVPIGNLSGDVGTNALFIVGNGLDNINRSNALVVRRDGRVGIGTNIPSRQLHINGDMRLTGALYDGNNQPGNADYILTSTVTGVNWVDIATLDGDWLVDGQNMSSIPTGNVGIGTTNPGAKLGVNGNILLTSDANREIGMQINNGGIGNKLTIHSTDMDDLGSGGDLILRGGGAGDPPGEGGSVFVYGGLGLPTAGSNVILAHTGSIARGKVGIGTSTPNEVLHVEGPGSGQLRAGQGSSFLKMGYDGFNCRIDAYDNGAPHLNRLLINYDTGGDVVMGGGPGGRCDLQVNGKISTCEVEVTNSGWCDYVFEDDYDLMPLMQVEEFIKQNKHLPSIPPASEIKEGGLKLGEMNIRMMEKIEELTLYLIELKRDNDQIREELELLKK